MRTAYLFSEMSVLNEMIGANEIHNINKAKAMSPFSNEHELGYVAVAIRQLLDMTLL